MTINKAKIALGFIVAGAVTLVFGGISLLVGPTAMTNQIIKVSWTLFLLSVFENEIHFPHIHAFDIKVTNFKYGIIT